MVQTVAKDSSYAYAELTYADIHGQPVYKRFSEDTPTHRRFTS